MPLAGVILAAAALVAVAAFVFLGPLGGRLPTGSPAAPSPAGLAGVPSGSPGTQASASAGATDSCPTSQPPPLAAGERRVATIDTERGSIEITLEADRSPIAVGNFVALAECGFYDGVVFHRTASLQDGTPFVIQGGDPEGTGSGGPGYNIQDEPVTGTYGRGVVAMARTRDPNSVGSQFFIVLSEAARGPLEDANTYQIIGTVTAGMEVADAIHAASGGQQLPTDPVVMDRVSISQP